ncbi:hypothetical protein, partial [Prosthecobacter sp.]|uniref:hypothetical protein n=1 Tax=Prosthecobacter sp. TaxID=1965333 RepID=UPI0026327F88
MIFSDVKHAGVVIAESGAFRATWFFSKGSFSQGLRTKTVENAKGNGGPESGVESTAFALAADGAFDLAGSEHFGREF